MVDLLVTAPAGEYTVFVGDAALAAPEYDLARADAALLDNVPALEVEVGPARANPAHTPPSMFERAGWEAVVLYAALGLAVLVLGLFTLRLARSEPVPSPVGAAPRGAAEPAADDARPAASPGEAKADAEPEAAEDADDSDDSDE